MKVALVVILEIGLVPALTLEAESWSGQESLQAGLAARRAVHKLRVSYLLQRIE